MTNSALILPFVPSSFMASGTPSHLIVTISISVRTMAYAFSRSTNPMLLLTSIISDLDSTVLMQTPHWSPHVLFLSPSSLFFVSYHSEFSLVISRHDLCQHSATCGPRAICGPRTKNEIVHNAARAILLSQRLPNAVLLALSANGTCICSLKHRYY